MKTDAEFRLAMAMHSNPGVYALLLGSGVSRAAGVATGWEVVLDLIRQVALAAGDTAPRDPETWFSERYGEEPDYGKLLALLARTQSERAALLRRYFEPTDVDKEQGLKTPTAAHRSIARLVKHGAVRVIVTTNFDRLVEQALEAEGIEPVVVTNDDSLKGAPPLQHSICTIIKLHGDYRDTRIKNTSDELAKYSSNLNRLLDRVFDEHGLVVCGWSAEWDVALRAALMRCATRRYSTFWLARHEPSDEAARLIAHRDCDLITISGAEDFLPRLTETLASLQDVDIPSPPSTAAAVATLKRYVAEERHRVRLHDLIVDETERTYEAAAALDWGGLLRERTRESFQRMMTRLEASTERLCAVVAALAYHGSARDSYLLVNCIERFVQVPDNWTRNRTDLWFYPAVLVTYSAGIAALVARRFENLNAVLAKAVYHDADRRDKPALTVCHALGAFANDTYKWVPRDDADREYTPASNYLHDRLREFVRDYIPDEARYSETFDLFEFVLGLVYFDIVEKEYSSWSPPGRFMWRWRDEWDSRPGPRFVAAIKSDGLQSPFLKAGFFAGSPERLGDKTATMKDWATTIGNRWH